MSLRRSCTMGVMLAATIGLNSVGTLSAQSASDVCRALSDVSVGQWVEYRFSPGPEGGPMTMYSAIVGTEDVEGKEYYWHESKMVAKQGTMIMQMLVPGYPFDVDQIQRSVMKMGDQPAMEVPDRMLGMMRNQGLGEDPVKDAVEKCEELREVGRESVTVPAGTFQTLHLKYDEDNVSVDMWVTPDVPFGIVKGTLPDGQEIVLVDHGTGAESSITETPQRMPGMR